MGAEPIWVGAGNSEWGGSMPPPLPLQCAFPLGRDLKALCSGKEMDIVGRFIAMIETPGMDRFTFVSRQLGDALSRAGIRCRQSKLDRSDQPGVPKARLLRFGVERERPAIPVRSYRSGSGLLGETGEDDTDPIPDALKRGLSKSRLLRER